MNKKINPKKFLRKMSGLPANEQFLKSLRGQLADYMKNTPPLINIQNPEKLFETKSFNFKMPAVLGLIVILLSGGATAFASQKSLPGETLYPVKLLTENIKLAVIFNPEEKIESRIALAKKRIEEIQMVVSAVQPKQALALESALNNFNSQLETILLNAQKLKNEGNFDKAYEVATEMKISMDNYRKIVKESKNERKIEFENDGENIISSINNFEGKIKIEFDDIGNLEKENMKIKGDKKSAENKINVAENSIKNAEKLIDKKEKKSDKQAVLSSKSKLIEAKNILDGAKTDYQNGNYNKSFDSAKKSIEATSASQLLIKVFFESKFYKNNDSNNNNEFENNNFNENDENKKEMNNKNIQKNILKTIPLRSNSGETSDFSKNNEEDDNNKDNEND